MGIGQPYVLVGIENLTLNRQGRLRVGVWQGGGKCRAAKGLNNSCSLSAGVRSEIQFVQSGAEIKKPGESMKLTCKASGYTFNEHRMSWIRQAPGKGLEWVASIRTDTFETFYPQNLKGRVTISVDVPLSTAYLQMNGLKSVDSAVYYCARGTVRRDTSLATHQPCRKWLTVADSGIRNAVPPSALMSQRI